MSAAPSPYAPGRALDEPQPPRPASRPAVFLWALFALALAGPQVLWMPFMRGIVAADRGLTFEVGAVIGAPGLLGLLWSYLCDRFPVFGTRRDGFLLLGAVVVAAAWAAAPLVPAAAGPWLGLGLALSLGAALMRAAINGGLAELAQSGASAGRLAAASVGVTLVGSMFGAATAELLDQRSLGWTAALGAAAMLSLVLLVALWWDRGDRPGAAPSMAPGLPAFLKSRLLWGTLPVLLLASLPGAAENILAPLFGQTTPPWPRATYERLQQIENLLRMLAAVLYFTLARRTSAGALLRLSLGAQVLATLGMVWAATTPEIVFVGWGLGQGLTRIAAVHVALLAAPRGREAFGYLLLMTPAMVLAPFVAPVVVVSLLTSLGYATAVVAIAGIALAALLAVPLVPASVRATRDA